MTGLTDISFKSSLAGATATPSPATESPAGSGIYTAKLTSTAPGSATVSVQKAGTDIAGVATQTIVFTHKVGAIAAAHSTFDVAPASIQDNGTSQSTLTLVAKDASGAAVVGLTDIGFALSGTAAAHATVGTVTESATKGTYTAKLTATSAGTVTVTPKQGNTNIAGIAAKDVTVTHVIGPVDGSKSTLTVTPTAFGHASGDKGVIAFVAKDASGAAVTGLTDITFDVSGAAAATTTAGTVTESSTSPGTYNADLTGTAAGAVVVKVKKGGTLVAGVAEVDVTVN